MQVTNFEDGKREKWRGSGRGQGEGGGGGYEKTAWGFASG